MGLHYSKEELSQIHSLVAEGLTSREIALRLGRSEAGVRNIRYRLNLRKRLEDNIRLLHEQKEKVQAQISELGQTVRLLSDDINSLEGKRKEYENLLNSDVDSIRKMIEEKLVELKIEKPELFYITGEEQIAKLVGYLLKWLLS